MNRLEFTPRGTTSMNRFPKYLSISLLEKSEVKREMNKDILDQEYIPLMKKIVEFESIAKKAIEEIAPQLVVKYLFELTQAFNTFYGKVKILDENDQEKTSLNRGITGPI